MDKKFSEFVLKMRKQLPLEYVAEAYVEDAVWAVLTEDIFWPAYDAIILRSEADRLEAEFERD